jgi:hypothetical protein
MARITKLLKLDRHCLLQWTFDDENLVSENYQVLNNLNTKERGFVSNSSNLNSLKHTAFAVDEVLNKYSQANLTKFNFLQTENYFTPNVRYDIARLYFPTTFSFSNVAQNDYKGIIFRVQAYDFYNTKLYDLSHYFYDDEDSTRQQELEIGTPFFYDEQQWSKYIELSLSSLNAIANQRVTANDGSNKVINNSINDNLTKGEGLSQSSPIFFDFRWISSTQTQFGTKSYFGTSPFRTSIAKSAEFENLGVQIQEATQGDYFEIYGTYAGANENLDDYIDTLENQGKRIRIEYEVSLYEENILQSQQTFAVEGNFAQKIKYRPIITFSNTTAAIQVTMNVIDLVNDTTETRFTSIGLTNNLFKYGSRLVRINVDNAYKPKLYAKNDRLILNQEATGSGRQCDLNITKVNYPLLIDKYKILTSSNAASGDYKGMGLLEIVFTPFDNIIKFIIAKEIEDNGQAVTYNLSDLLINAKLTLSFQSDSDFLEKELYRETDDNDFENGTVIFKIEQKDISILKKIYQNNRNFYLTLVGEFSGSRTLLYSGKFQLYENVQFLQNSPQRPIEPSIVDGGGGQVGTTVQFEEARLNDPNSPPSQNVQVDNVIDPESGLAVSSTPEGVVEPTPETKKNMLVFLKLEANENVFESELNKIIVRKTQLHTSYNMTYFLIGLTPTQIEEIKKIEGVDTRGTQEIPIGIGSSKKLGANDNPLTLNQLVDQANNITIEWRKSTTGWSVSSNSFISPPTAKELARWKTLLTPIMNSLRDRGFTLKVNYKPSPVFVMRSYSGGKVNFFGLTFF